MNQLSPLAWLAIAAIVVITIAVNLFMVSLLRSREKLDAFGRHMRSRGPSRTARTIQNVREITSDPFQKERQQLDALSKMVARIPKAPESKDAPPSSEEK